MYQRCVTMTNVGEFFCCGGGNHPGRFAPPSPKENHRDVPWVEVPTSLHLLELQLKPSLLAMFESTGVSALHTLPFGLNLGDAMGTQGIIGV